MDSTKVTKIAPVDKIELKSIEAPEQKQTDAKGNVSSRTEGQDSIKQEKNEKIKIKIGSELNRNKGIKSSCKKFWQKCWCPVTLLVPICIYVIFSTYFFIVRCKEMYSFIKTYSYSGYIRN